MSKITLEEYLEDYYRTKLEEPTPEQLEAVTQWYKDLFRNGREALNQKQNREPVQSSEKQADK